MATVAVGQEAPDFELYNSDKELFKLSEAKGNQNTLLLFYPGAFTGVCTTELNTVSNEIADYGQDTLIVGISTDSPFVQSEYKKVNNFGFALLSDHDAKVCAAYGAKYQNNFTGMNLDRIAKRSAFVVNKDGTVVYAEVLENAGELPDLDSIKDVLNGLS